MSHPQTKSLETLPTVRPGPDRASSKGWEGVNGNDVLDRKAALEHVEGDAVLLAELASLFVTDCPKMLSAIREVLERRDPEALARAAHTVKGSVANFAASKSYDAAFKLEQIGRRGDLAPAGEAVAALDEALEELCQALAAVAQGATR
ncbi:MAG TPA: Hpt domain-containing protein [Terriglobia bacterium]|nr:Hpt domain-containing protein [Terriglobia bacterium]